MYEQTKEGKETPRESGEGDEVVVGFSEGRHSRFLSDAKKHFGLTD